MKMLIRISVFFILFLSACGGKKSDSNKSDFNDVKTTSDKAEHAMDKITKSGGNETESAMTTTTGNSGSITRESLISLFLAPIKLNELYPSSPYKVKDEEVDNIASCNNFGLIDRNKLNSIGDLYWETVSKTDKNKIKLFKLASADFDKNSKAFVFDYTNSLDTFCINEGRKIKVRLVAGIRIVYTVKDWGLKVGIDGLEKIAASKELNFSQSSLHVRTIGWGQETTSILGLKSAIQKINVKNYPEACQALLDLMTAYANTAQVRPEAIPVE